MPCFQQVAGAGGTAHVALLMTNTSCNRRSSSSTMFINAMLKNSMLQLCICSLVYLANRFWIALFCSSVHKPSTCAPNQLGNLPGSMSGSLCFLKAGPSAMAPTRQGFSWKTKNTCTHGCPDSRIMTMTTCRK